MRGAARAGIICRNGAETFPVLQMRHWGSAPQFRVSGADSGTKTAQKQKNRVEDQFKFGWPQHRVGYRLIN